MKMWKIVKKKKKNTRARHSTVRARVDNLLNIDATLYRINNHELVTKRSVIERSARVRSCLQQRRLAF